MKILWLTKKYFDIATDRTTRLEMMRALHARGHQVTLVTTFKKNKPKWENPDRVVYLPTIKAPGLNHFTFVVSAWFYLIYAFLTDRLEIIMVDQHAAPAAFPLCLLARAGLTRSRFFLDIRTVPVETAGFTGWLEHATFRFSIVLAKYLFSGVAVISPAMKDLFAKEYGLADDKMGVWSSGVSLTHFNPKSIPPNELRLIRNQLDLDGRFIVLYHGTLSMNRGLFETVEACQIAVKSCSDLCLVVIGHGDASDKLAAMADSLNLESSFRLLKAVPYDDMPAYIALADVGILPFPDIEWWRVSSPLKLLEYLAMGKPVVVTDIEAHRQVLGTSPAGFFARSSDPADLSDAILKAYRSGTAQLRAIGPSARKLVEREYTWDKQAERLEAFLKHE